MILQIIVCEVQRTPFGEFFVKTYKDIKFYIFVV